MSARGDGHPYSTSFGDTSSNVSRTTSECSDAPAPTGLSVTGSTASSVSLSWNPVTDAYRYKLERSTSSSGPWTDAGSETGDTSGTATGLDCGTTYYFRVSARGDGSPYSTTFGSASSSVSRATSACLPTIGVDLQNPFVGQAVTMTVSTTGSSGTVSSYQWQEWSAGSWTDLGATTTSATRSESSSVAGYRSFRVVVAYTSGTPVESYAITIQWREMSVGVTSSPAYPRSGLAATSTVTLTAGGDMPSGVVYQWQEWSSGAWTDLGATTTSATKDVTSATRGTRKFRVVVSHAVVSPATSEPVYVTWDEWDIVAEMIGELSAAVATSTAYTTAQDALLTCMSATSTTSTDPGPKSPSDSRAPTMPPAVTIATFDDLLANYTGDVKARMDAGGDCAATSTTMFSTNESVARAELARLKVGNAVYAGVLDKPHGQQFEANVGNSARLKLFSYLMASQPSATSNNGGDVSGNSDTTPPPVLEPGGFNCLTRAGVNPTLNKKLEALNCLVFATPHSFWREYGGDMEQLVDGPAYWLPDGSMTIGPFRWFSYGGGDNCSTSPDAPTAACHKHDVMWGSLKKFDGIGDSPTGLDAAWNPRNKLLADIKLVADTKKYDCDDTESFPLDVPAEIFCALPASAMGSVMEYAIRTFADSFTLIAPNWPYTQEDLNHAARRLYFVQCDGPSLTNVSITPRRTALGFAFRANWEFEDGCGQGITIGEYTVSLDIVFQPNCLATAYGPFDIRQTDNRAYAEFELSSSEISALSSRCDTTSARSILSLRAYPNNLLSFSGQDYYSLRATAIPTEFEHGP